MFSSEEKKLILDKEFFVAKKNITHKIYSEFEEVKKEVEHIIKTQYNFLPNEIIATGKINRGENLKGLPWINLDYPGYFKQQNVFAIRYLFWWGNHFSVTLHLGGDYLKQYQSQLIGNIDGDKTDNLFWCANSIPWHYDYSNENYCSIKKLTEEQIQDSLSKNFVKVSVCFELSELENFKTSGVESAERLLQLIL